MATGNELILGFLYENSGDLLQAMGIQMLCLESPDSLEIGFNLPEHLSGKNDDEVNDWITENIVFFNTPDFRVWDDLPILKEINEALVKAHYEACLEMGWILKKVGKYPEYPVYETPKGLREFSPFNLEVHFDHSEMGEKPEHAVIGVSVSGRYFPTFVDWENKHGTIYNIICDPNQLIWQVAKKHICAVLPCFKNAQWIIKEKFY
jgi:hypothetical protein